MKLLLDTHVILWWLDNAKELSELGKQIISSQENIVFISAVSIWEMRIKESIGKLSLPKNFEEVLEEEPFERLSLTVRHAYALKNLPPLHKDPFDRMLVTQASLDDLTLVTHDEILTRYEVKSKII